MTSAEFRPKVLLVTRNFPPLTGGMERLMQKAAEGISSYADITIVGPKGCAEYAPPSATVHEVPFGLLPFLTLGCLSAIRACLKTKFDVVLGGSGLAAPTLWILKTLFRLRTAIFIHGLDIVVDNVIYQKLFVPAVTMGDLIIANSRNTRLLAIERGADPQKIIIINPGTSLPDPESLSRKDLFSSRHGLQGRKVILFTGRITRRKGLSEFIALSLPDILSAESDATVLVVGDSPAQSLNKQGESEDVVKAIAQSNIGDHVQFLGNVSDEDLLSAYAAADVQIFPLIAMPGDVEGFGMVAIEAAACGTPTVAFAVGGVEDAVSAANGYLVPAKDYKSFTAAVITALVTQAPDSESCIAHAQKFSWETYNGLLSAALKRLAQT